MKRILVVEDEPIILKALHRLLERNHYEVHGATNVTEALDARPLTFDLILADLRLPGEPGTALIKLADPVPVVIMTSHASVRSAVDAMRYGAIDYIAKPFDHDELLLVIERSLQQNLMQSQNRALKLNIERMHPVAQHVQGTQLEHVLNLICQSEQPYRYLHLFGEPGTDKESLASAVHASGPNKEGPFLVLDISADTVSAASLLLGLGNATQMQTDKKPLLSAGLPSGGFLQAAQNGTLVIRYPELLDTCSQHSLLRLMAGNVLDGQDASRQRIANVSLISISTSSMGSLVREGLVSTELAELFQSHQFEVPALRLRPRDIIPLARRHLDRLETRYAHKHMTLSEDAVAALMANDWPGNVSELEGLLERAVLHCRTKTIGLNDLGVSTRFDVSHHEGRDLSLDEYFRYFVLRNQTHLSETELASRLGISRKALWERRQKMNLPRDTNENLSS